MRKGCGNAALPDEGTVLRITAEEIQERLGLSTVAIPAEERLSARHIAMIREAGITRIEVCGLFAPSHYDYHDRGQVSEIMAECDRQGVSIVSVHGPNLPYDCPYEEVRKAVAKEAVAAVRVAEEMGASIFVGHFNTNEFAERTVREMLDQLDGCDVKLTVENLTNLVDIPALVDRVGSERFGVTLDIGHERDEDGVDPFLKNGGAQRIIALCGQRLLHLHLHDFLDAGHYPPFEGNVHWDEVLLALQEVGYTGEIMFEAITRASVEGTLKRTAAFPEEFVRRHGQ